MEQNSICNKHMYDSLILGGISGSIFKMWTEQWTEKWTQIKLKTIESPPPGIHTFCAYPPLYELQLPFRSTWLHLTHNLLKNRLVGQSGTTTKYLALEMFTQ